MKPHRFIAAALCMVAAACGAAPAPPADRIAPATATASGPAAPAGLQARLEIAAANFPGRVGLAVRDVESGWTASVNGTIAFPQQSVSKLWVALAVLEAVDRRTLRLDEPVLVRREDLSVFHQPIRAHVDDDGYLTTVEALLRGALIQSDNAANDILMRRVGGPEAVQAVLADKGVRDVRLGDEERFLQARIAGLTWRPQHALDGSFWTERELVPMPTRVRLLNDYVASPPDGATPNATVEALARLRRGELLSVASTARMLEILEAVETGPMRLKAGLPAGWRLAHKTGTGQVLGPRATGFNDVGLITAPDGRVYAIAMFIADTEAGVPQRQALMQEAARAVVDHHLNAAVLRQAYQSTEMRP